MATVDRINVEIEAGADKLSQDLNDAESRVDETSRNMEASIGRVGESWREAAANATAVVAGAALVARGIAFAAEKAIDLANGMLSVAAASQDIEAAATVNELDEALRRLDESSQELIENIPILGGVIGSLSDAIETLEELSRGGGALAEFADAALAIASVLPQLSAFRPLTQAAGDAAATREAIEDTKELLRLHEERARQIEENNRANEKRLRDLEREEQAVIRFLEQLKRRDMIEAERARRAQERRDSQLLDIESQILREQLRAQDKLLEAEEERIRRVFERRRAEAEGDQERIDRLNELEQLQIAAARRRFGDGSPDAARAGALIDNLQTAIGQVGFAQRGGGSADRPASELTAEKQLIAEVRTADATEGLLRVIENGSGVILPV